MQGLTTIHLGGQLGQIFGAKWELHVSSVAEAIRAIDANVKGKFRQYLLKDGHNKFYNVGIGKETVLIDKEELTNRSGNADIFILPIVGGASTGAGKIIAGVVLVIIGAFTSIYGGGYFIQAGVSLILGGIVQLLTPVPNFNNNTEGDSRGSNLFNGNASSVSQGGAVGLIYGRALVTPMPVSISFDNVDVINPDNAGLTEYCTVQDGSGSTQYVPREPDQDCP